jgi:hypothetical protein
MKKRTKTTKAQAVGKPVAGDRPAAHRRLLQRRVQPRFCEWCAKNFAENTALGLDSKFYHPCEDRLCPSGRTVRGIIVLDGDRRKVEERLERILHDAYPPRLNTEVSHADHPNKK